MITINEAQEAARILSTRRRLVAAEGKANYGLGLVGVIDATTHPALLDAYANELGNDVATINARLTEIGIDPESPDDGDPALLPTSPTPTTPTA